MNYNVYRLYAEAKVLVDKLEANIEECGEDELTLLADMKLNNVILEEKSPELLRRYIMEQKMFKSFTPEQRDFICSQIGWWYVMWKDNMWIENEPNQHWLGRGKEDLKTMICGD